MPSTLHEVLIELFRHRPPLAAELLTDPFDIKLPAWDKVSVLSSDFSELVPTEYRADLVTLFSDVADAPVQAVVLEVQLRRDPRKLRSWPAYVAMLYARLGCPSGRLS